MTTAYLAEDLKHHRQGAVKVLRPELAASIGTERFVGARSTEQQKGADQGIDKRPYFHDAEGGETAI